MYHLIRKHKQLLTLLILASFQIMHSYGQTNVGLTATSTHIGGGGSAAGYGPELYNDNIIPATTGLGPFNWGWVNTNGWIEYTWANPTTFNKVVFYKDNRPMTTCTFQYWDDNTSQYVNFFNYNNTAIEDSVTFIPITTTKLRFNNIAGSSNPNFREIQVVLTQQGVDNAGINSLLSPINFCAGDHDIRVRIQNFGGNRIDSVRVNWELDGVFQNTIYHTQVLDTSGGSGSSTADIFLSNETFAANVSRTIKVWTSYPNGKVDPFNLNDTQVFVVRPSLNGTFTIGGSGANYPNFASAVNDLRQFGVCGPVDFYVNAGTYNERIEITSIAGSSSTNRIRFIGAGQNASILTNAGTGTADMNTLTLDGADFLEFRNMRVVATGASNGIGILLTNGADSNIFSNVTVEVSTTATGTLVSGIVFSGSKTSAATAGNTGNYNTIDSCLVIGGYYGIRINGPSSTLYVTNNTITNTRIERAYYYSLYFLNVNEHEVENCYLDFPRNTTNYGFYASQYANFQFNNNTVLANNYSVYLLNVNSNNYNSNIVSQISNNLMVANVNYGFYSTGGGRFRFVHNSVSASALYAVYPLSGNNMVFLNNHMQNFRGTSNSYAFYSNAGFDSLDYNNYWSTGPDNFVWLASVGYNDLSAYKAANASIGFEQNSYNQNPNFLSNSNLRINQNIENLRGAFAGISTDRDGDARCEFSPTLGADESQYPTLAPDAIIVTQDTIYLESPTRLFSAFAPAGNTLLDYTWYIDGVQESKQRNYNKTFNALGSYQVKLRVRSCNANATDSLDIDVVNPTSVPNTAFTASKVIADVLENITLNDLSLFGPNRWEWSVSPDADAILSDAFASNPTVAFLLPGDYEVCLTTWNDLGQGNRVCKPAYISINDDQIFCTASSSELPAGRLTDEGGIFNNYSANTNCSFLIQPCASEVTLRFTDWRVNDADDVLTIYDGTDRNGALLGTFNGTSALPGGAAGITATSGSMYIEWRTSPAGQEAGFVAFWSSEPDTNAVAPIADFSTPDTVFVNQVVRFESSTQAPGTRYNWDFDPPMQEPGLDGGAQASDRYQWSQPGTYPVRLSIRTCGGNDAEQKNITVVAPTSAPVPHFSALRVRVPVLSTVRFIDSSYQGPTSWAWSVSPAITTNIVGANNQPEMRATFLKSGFYDVKLKVGNSVGEDSLTKTSYIEVFDYCTPVVANLSSDIGITRVQFGNVDNYSTAGQSSYSNYTDVLPAAQVSRRGNFNVRIERQSTIDPMSRKIWIDWNNDGDFNDSLEEVAYEASARTRSFTASINVPTFASIGFTTMRVGVSYSSDPNRACGINATGEFEDYALEITRDNIPPIITLNGAQNITIEQGYSYTELGAQAFDLVDGDISALIIISSNVDTSQVGVYQVRYNVTDLDGNQAQEVIRTVTVMPDVTKPVITLIGPASINVTVNTSYTDAGATASDYFNIDLTPQMISGDNIDLGNLGTYYVWFSVADAAGNTDSVVRTINVIDDVAPIITLVGSDTIHMEVFGNINEPGASSTDNFDPIVSVSIDSSAVRKDLIGIYPMIYSAQDAAGNLSTKTRWVKVEDNQAPIITLIGNDTVIVDVFTSYIEQGARVTDNYCQNLTWTANQTPNTNLLGEYIITYTSTDCNGNQAQSINRVVKVVDRIAPVISLNGFAAISIQRWEGYNDQGVSLSDNYYSESVLQDSLVITSNFDPNWVGLYSVCYQVTDPSGNTSKQLCRTIRVTENTTSIEGLNTQELKLWPNPGKGTFTLESESLRGEVEIVVTDMNGKQVWSGNFQNESTIRLNLDSLGSGLYLVNVIQANFNKTLKLQIH